MKSLLSSFLGGFSFAIGLGFSGMTNPKNIIGFLNLGSEWQPALIFVMGGALMVHLMTYRWIAQRKSPLFDGHFHTPTRKDLTAPLIVGSILFGMGWGLAGYCPGPAVVALATGQGSAVVFVLFMIIGMYSIRFLPSAFKKGM